MTAAGHDRRLERGRMGVARVLHGDCLDVLPTLGPDGFHACVTDPPYHFASIIRRWSGAEPGDRTASGAMGRHSRGFMGETWDGGDVAFRPETWAAVLRVLKPGAHLVAFGGTKGFHRLACAVEDAGFEIRDTIMWLYGTGFPKNHSASKALAKSNDSDLFREAVPAAVDAWEGWGTALKPAYEPIVLARKPLIGTVGENLREHGTGALNIDGCRIPGSGNKTFLNRHAGDRSREQYRTRTASQSVPTDQGRWPANVAHDGSDEVVAAFPAQAGALAPVRRRKADKFRNTYGAFRGDVDEEASTFRGDSGSAARFFYCAKATKAERAGSKHPTIKPLALMRWLVRLVTPPGGLILDPFAGTGTTAQAAVEEGFGAVLIEREAKFIADIEGRLAAAQPRFSEAAE